MCTVPHVTCTFSFHSPRMSGRPVQHHLPILDEDGHRRELQGLAQGAEWVLTPEPTSCSGFIAVTQGGLCNSGPHHDFHGP